MDADSSNGPRRLVPIPAARQWLGEIGHTTIYELINRGEILKVNIGRRSFITSESLEAYVDRLGATPSGGGPALSDSGLPDVPDPAHEELKDLP